MAIELDVFQEIKLDENSGEIVMRPMAEGMDAPLDFIDEEDEPEWASLMEVLTETMIDPYVVSASTEVPNEKDYHMMVAASEDLFSVANDFARKVEELHTIDLALVTPSDVLGGGLVFVSVFVSCFFIP